MNQPFLTWFIFLCLLVEKGKDTSCVCAIRNCSGARSFDREIAVFLRCNISPRYFFFPQVRQARSCSDARGSSICDTPRISLTGDALTLIKSPIPWPRTGSPECYDDEHDHEYSCSLFLSPSLRLCDLCFLAPCCKSERENRQKRQTFRKSCQRTIATISFGLVLVTRDWCRSCTFEHF